MNFPTHCLNCQSSLVDDHRTPTTLACDNCQSSYYCFVRLNSERTKIIGWGTYFPHNNIRYYLRSMNKYYIVEPSYPRTDIEYDHSLATTIISVPQYFPYPLAFAQQECHKILVRLLNLVVFS